MSGTSQAVPRVYAERRGSAIAVVGFGFSVPLRSLHRRHWLRLVQGSLRRTVPHLHWLIVMALDAKQRRDHGIGAAFYTSIEVLSRRMRMGGFGHRETLGRDRSQSPDSLNSANEHHESSPGDQHQ
jgi:hypothetical protein